jgi:hypothetical protein
MMLIRIGHHLWRSRKRREWPEEAVLSALRDVWDRKAELRAVYREQWLELCKNRANNLPRKAKREELIQV